MRSAEGKRQQLLLKGCCKALCPGAASEQNSTEAGDGDLLGASPESDHFGRFLTAAFEAAQQVEGHVRKP